VMLDERLARLDLDATSSKGGPLMAVPNAAGHGNFLSRSLVLPQTSYSAAGALFESSTEAQ
jgi:hypothetical protein